MTATRLQAVEQYVESNFPGYIMKSFPDALIDYAAETGDFTVLDSYTEIEIPGRRSTWVWLLEDMTPAEAIAWLTAGGTAMA